MNKMNLKKVKYLSHALVAGVALMALLCILTRAVAFVWLMLAFALAAAYVETTLWRCPVCGGLLGAGGGKFCPHCGHHLMDLE